MPRSITAVALRSSGRTASSVQGGELVAQVRGDHEVALLAPSSRVARLVAWPTASALLCSDSTAASLVKTSMTTRPYLVFPLVFGLQPVVGPLRRGGLAEGLGLRDVHVPLPREYSLWGSRTLKSSARASIFLLEHAGAVRVEGHHLCAVAPPVPVRFFHFVTASRPRRSPASGPRSCWGACTAWPPRSRRAAGAPPGRPRPSPSSPGCPTSW